MPLSRITNPTLASGNNQITFSSNTYSYSAGAQTYYQITHSYDPTNQKPAVRLGLNTQNPNRTLHVKGLGSGGSAEVTLEQANPTGNTIQANGKFWNILVDAGTSNQPSNFTVRKLNDDASGNTAGGFFVDGITGVFTTLTSRKINPASVPAGSIIQIVQHTMPTSLFSSSGTNSVLDITGWSKTFTPQYNNSKVLHIITIGLKFVCDGRINIKRNGTVVSPSLGDTFREMQWDATVDMTPVTMHWMDSPATTSQITYQLTAQAEGCGFVIAVGSSADFTPFWTMMEVAV